MTATPSGQRILVVEDSPAIQRLIEICLRQPERELEQSLDAASAIEAIRDRDPDLVILDICLPGTDGWEVLRQLRDSDDDKHIAVLVLSAQVDAATRTKALIDGADGFLTKPFLPKVLRDAVDELVDA